MKIHKEHHRHDSAGFQGNICQKRSNFHKKKKKAFPQLRIAVSNAILGNCLQVKCSTSKRVGIDPSLQLRQTIWKALSQLFCLPPQEIKRWVLCCRDMTWPLWFYDSMTYRTEFLVDIGHLHRGVIEDQRKSWLPKGTVHLIKRTL